MTSATSANYEYYVSSLVSLVSKYCSSRLVSAVGLNNSQANDIRQIVKNMKDMGTPIPFNSRNILPDESDASSLYTTTAVTIILLQRPPGRYT